MVAESIVHGPSGQVIEEPLEQARTKWALQDANLIDNTVCIR